MSRLTLNSRERTALTRISERPRPFGEVAAEHVEPLIRLGLARCALGHYLITTKGQLELHRQMFRDIRRRGRAQVDEGSLLYLQESRAESDYGYDGRPEGAKASVFARFRGLLKRDAEPDPRPVPAVPQPAAPRAPRPRTAPAGALQARAEPATTLPWHLQDQRAEQHPRAAEAAQQYPLLPMPPARRTAG